MIAISYTYQQIVSELVRRPANKTEPEKVAAAVATFLNEGSDGLQTISIKN